MVVCEDRLTLRRRVHSRIAQIPTDGRNGIMGKWSRAELERAFEEDIYNPAHFQQMMKGWLAAKAKDGH